MARARFRRVLAVGDPQAPFAKLLGILEAHGALGDHGKLRDDVQLVSMGDHFDFGKPETREQAAADGIATLAWLADHPPEQVVVLLGNHDLSRVAELAHHTDESFEALRAEADAVYRGGAPDPAAEHAFLAKHPELPAAEMVARDYSTFTVGQRAVVTELLRGGRFRLAHEHRGLLLTHAAVTRDDLRLAGAPDDSAGSAAAGLNAFLDARVRAWSSGPLDLGHVYRTGSAERGESRGALAHRPSDPSAEEPAKFEGPPRRRFDPRSLPDAFPQALGHIRDSKCRELLRAWADDVPAQDGPVRSLAFAQGVPRYRHGCQPDARLYFVDNGMSHAAVDRYELFDLDARQPASKLVMSGT